MSKEMTVNERIRAVIDHQSVDRIPLFIEGITHGGNIHINERFPDQFERALYYLEKGIDTGIVMEVPCFSFKDVEIKQWIEPTAEEQYPLIHTRYRTPRGDLMQIVRKTEDYPGGDKLSSEKDVASTRSPDCTGIICDYNIPATRSKQYLVEKEEDLEKLTFLLNPDLAHRLSRFREQAEKTRLFCDQHQIPFSVYVWGIGDPLIWMSGVERCLMMAMEEKTFFARYVEMIARWNRRLIEIAIDAGANHIIRRGIYESTDFWSPDMYEEFFLKPLAGEVALSHQAGLSFNYVMYSGVMPLLQQIKRAGINIFASIDPMASGMDGRKIREEFAESVAVCGGINNYHVLERGTPEQVRQAARDALAVFTPREGCILAPSDVLMLGEPATIDRNVDIMIETWREEV